MKNYIKLRGHHLEYLHFLDNYNVNQIKEEFSKYGAEFIENAIKLLEKVKNKKMDIMVVDQPDDLCEKCRWKTQKGCYKNITIQESTLSVEDRDEIQFYGLQVGKIYTPDYLLEKL